MPTDILVRLPEYVSSRILARGMDYYRNNLIETPERVSEYKWTARAFGQQVYDTTLTFNPDDNDEWHCNCPYEGPVCKHVVGACFAVLRVAEDTYPGISHLSDLYNLPSLESALTINQLFEVLEKEELLAFLRNQLRENYQLASIFEIEFLHRLPEKQKSEQYRYLVSKEVRNALNKQAFIHYREDPDFYYMDDYSGTYTIQMKWLLELSKKHRAENRPEESLLICKAILEEVPASLKILEADGTDFNELPDAGELMDSAAEELSSIAESVNEQLKKSLFAQLRKMFSNEDLHIGNVPYHLLRAMSLSATDANSKEQHLDLLNNLVDGFRNNSQSFIDEHQLQEIKILYLQQIRKAKEAVEVMVSLKDEPSFCLMLVHHYIKEGHHKEAKELCLQGLEKFSFEAEKVISLHTNDSDPLTWYKLLYEIAESENNLSDMRTWLTKLIFADYEHMKWFREYKETWSETEWTVAREEIIDKQKKVHTYPYFDGFLADIYIEEKLLDRLEEMLSVAAGFPLAFHSICSYASKMAVERPQGSCNVMQRAIEAYAAENVGRNYYKEIAYQLQVISTWKGCRERARSIGSSLIKKYPARRAMKQELEQVFTNYTK